MKILALTRYTALGASSRMRTYQFLPALNSAFIKVDVAPLLRDSYIINLYSGKPPNWLQIFMDYFKRLVILFSAKHYDLLWIEKELFQNFPPWIEKLLAAFGVPYVIDIDDAIFHTYELAKSPLKRLFRNKIDLVMRKSRLVTCGSPYLAQRAIQAGASRVEIIPTVIDMERYGILKQHGNARSPLRVIWIGTPGTVRYLDTISLALKELATMIDFELLTVGACYSIDGVRSSYIPWTEETEVASILEGDIGIMPLVDSPFERGKCGYKLIQYMACGLPVVASPIGVNAQIVHHHENGFLAQRTSDWINSLRSLIIDSDLRSRQGLKGRQMVSSGYSLQNAAPRLITLLRSVI